MPEPEDFWGDDFDTSAFIPPITILKEQAAALGRKTQQLVIAEIETTPFNSSIQQTMILIAPALDNYRYKLFTTTHDIELYPTRTSFGGVYYEAKDAEEFRSDLRIILADPSTQRIVKSLLAQSKA